MLTKKITKSRVGLVCLGFSEINKRILELENELRESIKKSQPNRPDEDIDFIIENSSIIDETVKNEMRILRELRKNETRAKNDN